MTPLKKACSEARPRADFRTRGRLRELFSVHSTMTPLKKACSEARPRADCRTRGRLRELFSVDSTMKPVSLLLILLVVVTPACSNRQEITTPPIPRATAANSLAPPARGFSMGVAGIIPRNFPNSSADDWLNLYDTLAETGELLGVYTNWTDSPETAGEIPQVVSTAFGLALRYGFTPLVTLGFYRDAPGGGVEPTLSWTNSDDRDKFKQVAVTIAQQYQPRHLALGGEVNRYYEHDPAGFDDFVAAYAETYDAIKAVSPQTLVFPIFQLEMTKGGGYLMGRSQERQPQWELLDRFGERLDLAAFTTYPFLDYAAPADLPEDYYAEIAAHTARLLAFTEIGWPSALLDTAPDSEYGGSEEEQVAFVHRFFQLTSDTNLALALWAFPHDLGLASPNSAMASIALRHNDGTPKPALAAWQERVQLLPVGK